MVFVRKGFQSNFCKPTEVEDEMLTYVETQNLHISSFTRFLVIPFAFAIRGNIFASLGESLQRIFVSSTVAYLTR